MLSTHDVSVSLEYNSVERKKKRGPCKLEEKMKKKGNRGHLLMYLCLAPYNSLY